MREKMLKLPTEFHTGTPAERFKRLAKALLTVPKKATIKDEPKKARSKQRKG
ncbi:MAG TPA: hypothetical protein VGN86_02560 [Pyrinomonadaceae bacterium]|jgi:hypothetical protein|nr:hypothetical protein [Pyrinomonadaceae bacterium]